MIEIKAENLGGESITEGTVKVCKNVGDSVQKDDVIFIIETDKTSLEFGSPESGVITELLVKDDDKIERGQVLAKMTVGDAGAKASPATTESMSQNPEKIAPTKGSPVVAGPAQNEAIAQKKDAPAARNMMDNLAIDRSFVQGTGKDGRVTKPDVLNYASGNSAAAPCSSPISTAAVPAIGREERVKMTKIRKIIAARLKESQNTAAILTTFNEIDMKAVMDLRAKYKDLFEKKHGIKLGFMSIFIKAVVAALKDVPLLNAEISGDDIVYKHYYDIGVAVGTDKGLVVPVLRDCDNKSLAQLENDLAAFAVKAREGKLQVADLNGATFTISNGGVYGSLFSTPIINPPQSGILGMHAIQKRPVVVGDNIEVRPMMYVAVSYDHRIVDGQGAVTFLVKVKNYVEDLHRLLLEL